MLLYIFFHQTKLILFSFRTSILFPCHPIPFPNAIYPSVYPPVYNPLNPYPLSKTPSRIGHPHAKRSFATTGL